MAALAKHRGPCPDCGVYSEFYEELQIWHEEPACPAFMKRADDGLEKVLAEINEDQEMVDRLETMGEDVNELKAGVLTRMDRVSAYPKKL